MRTRSRSSPTTAALIAWEEAVNLPVEGEDDSGKGKRLRVSLLPAAQPILDDIAQGLEDYDQARFAGFSREELERYSDLSGKIQENMRRVLQ